jgi:HEAT repeat protein
VTLAEAAAQAADLASRGAERELADLRAQWADELEAAIRSQDFRERVVAYQAIGQFRFKAKTELLRRGLEDESPACRGASLLSLAALSKESPGLVNGVRPLLHRMVDGDPNAAVRRLVVVCLGHGSPQREVAMSARESEHSVKVPGTLTKRFARFAGTSCCGRVP